MARTMHMVMVMRPILAYLHLVAGISVNQHVDDGIINAPSGPQCVRDTQLVLDTLSQLNFLVNWEKTLLRPSQLRVFSGMLHDSKAMVRRLTVKRMRSVRRGAAQLLSKMHRGLPVSLRLVASALGRERAARDCVVICYLMTREILRWQNAALKLLLVEMGIPVPCNLQNLSDPCTKTSMATVDALIAKGVQNFYW